MSTTTDTPKYEIGSRSWTIQNLARSMRFHADNVDALADRVEDWGWNPQARTALGLIEVGQDLQAQAVRFLREMKEIGVGSSTCASYRNEASSIGAGLNDRGTLGYGLMHALGEVEKIESGEYNRVAWRQSKTAVKASGMRVHASNVRVICGMLDRLASGEIWGIR